MSDNKVPQPKMYNTNKYRKNYESIAWEFVVCSECGQVYKYEDRLKYMDYKDGEWNCKGECNFN